MEMKTKVIIGKYRSEDVIYNSSSGGAFTVLYEYAIENDYVVYGVKFDNDFKVQHSRATTIKECEEFRKSKYVLSDMKSTYQQIGQDLKNDKYVLFTGTPCQCAGVLNYLKVKHIEASKLLVVDLICHGGPNQLVFDQYRIENEKLMGDDWFRFRFKEKYSENGKVNSRTAGIDYKSGKFIHKTISNDPFLKGYYNRLFYRKSCKECPFAKPDRISDITIGDAWGIEKSRPEWDSSAGISLIILNTKKGMDLLPKFEKKMELIESSLKWAVDNNSQLGKPTEMHINRDVFFKLLPKIGFEEAVERSLKISIWKRCVRKIRNIIKNE